MNSSFSFIFVDKTVERFSETYQTQSPEALLLHLQFSCCFLPLPVCPPEGKENRKKKKNQTFTQTAQLTFSRDALQTPFYQIYLLFFFTFKLFFPLKMIKSKL